MDRSICIIGIDLSHISVPMPHIRIDLCIIWIDLSHIAVPIPHIRIDLSALLG